MHNIINAHQMLNLDETPAAPKTLAKTVQSSNQGAEYVPKGEKPAELPMPDDLQRTTVVMRLWADGDVVTGPIPIIFPKAMEANSAILLAQQQGFKETGNQKRTFSPYFNNNAWNNRETFTRIVSNDILPGIDEKRVKHGCADPTHELYHVICLWDEPRLHEIEDIDVLLQMHEAGVHPMSFPHNTTQDMQAADDEECFGLAKTLMGQAVRAKMGHAPGQKGIIQRLALGGKWNALDIFLVTIPILRGMRAERIRQAWKNTKIWPLDINGLEAKGRTVQQTNYCRPMVPKLERDVIKKMLPTAPDRRQQLVEAQQLTWGEVESLARAYIEPYNEAPYPPLPRHDAVDDAEQKLYAEMKLIAQEYSAVADGIVKVRKAARKAEVSALRDEENTGNDEDAMAERAKESADARAKTFNNREKVLVGKKRRKQEAEGALDAFKADVTTDKNDGVERDDDADNATLEKLKDRVEKTTTLLRKHEATIAKHVQSKSSTCRTCKAKVSG